MNELHGITAENLLATLPPVLQGDAEMLALATSIADALAKRPEEIRKIQIYTRIDELPEDLVDILAYDFKVDWYNYDYPVEIKRDLLKSSFDVHRHMGTRGAVCDALSSIYPGATVEEWFEYGGKPFYFRIIIDVTNQRVSISNEEVVRTVNLYKSLRSHLDSNSVWYRSRATIAIKTSCGYVVYSTRLCGTYPINAMEGGTEKSGITIESADAGVAYSVRMCGATPGSIL